MKFAPILLFVYNRPHHTARTLSALLENAESRESDVYIFSDGAKNSVDELAVKEVRKVISETQGFHSKTIVERAENIGLANSIITGVTKIVGEHERAIVLEDDMVVGRYFLEYMNRGLTYYRSADRVASLHGWNFPLKERNLPCTFFLRGADCWGWATWKRAWRLFEPDGAKLLTSLEQQNLTHEFDLDGEYPYTQMLRDQIGGKNNSWAIRWHASMFLHNKLTLYPGNSLVENIGLDGSGVHSKPTKVYETKSSQEKILQFPAEIKLDSQVRQMIIGYLRNANDAANKHNAFYLLVRIYKKLRTMLGHN